MSIANILNMNVYKDGVKEEVPVTINKVFKFDENFSLD